MAHEKTIKVGFSEADWSLLDDKRHNSKTTFQAVGETLLRAWLDGVLSVDSLSVPNSEQNPPKEVPSPTAENGPNLNGNDGLVLKTEQPPTEYEKGLLSKALRALHCGDGGLRKAIIHNLIQFDRLAGFVTSGSQSPASIAEADQLLDKIEAEASELGDETTALAKATKGREPAPRKAVRRPRKKPRRKAS